MEQSKEVTWLRQVLQPEDEEGPKPKRVKVSDIHDSLEAQFSPSTYSHRVVSSLLNEAFPQAYTKPAGKTRVMHLHGIDWKQPPSRYYSHDVQTSTSLVAEVGQHDTRVKDAQASTSFAAENLELKLKVQQLEARVTELEQCSSKVLADEATAVIQHATYINHGPDTPEHFEQYSFARVMAELKLYAPNLFQLVLKIGDTGRNVRPDEMYVSNEELKAATSVCTLLNAHSVRSNGMQLMTSLMMIARATSRQVNSLFNLQLLFPIKPHLIWLYFGKN